MLKVKYIIFYNNIHWHSFKKAFKKYIIILENAKGNVVTVLQ